MADGQDTWPAALLPTSVPLQQQRMTRMIYDYDATKLHFQARLTPKSLVIDLTYAELRLWCIGETLSMTAAAQMCGKSVNDFPSGGHGSSAF